MPQFTLVLLSAATLVASTAAQAQSLQAPSEEVIDRIASFPRDNLARAKLSDGSFVPPETPQERARPIIAPELIRQTVMRGFLTGEMQACGMNWQESGFLPYMTAVRAARRYSGKQLAYIGLLHGISQGRALQAMAERAAPCSEAERQGLIRAVRETPVGTLE